MALRRKAAEKVAPAATDGGGWMRHGRYVLSLTTVACFTAAAVHCTWGVIAYCGTNSLAIASSSSSTMPRWGASAVRGSSSHTIAQTRGALYLRRARLESMLTMRNVISPPSRLHTEAGRQYVFVVCRSNSIDNPRDELSYQCAAVNHSMSTGLTEAEAAPFRLTLRTTGRPGEVMAEYHMQPSSPSGSSTRQAPNKPALKAAARRVHFGPCDTRVFDAAVWGASTGSQEPEGGARIPGGSSSEPVITSTARTGSWAGAEQPGSPGWHSTPFAQPPHLQPVAFNLPCYEYYSQQQGGAAGWSLYAREQQAQHQPQHQQQYQTLQQPQQQAQHEAQAAPMTVAAAGEAAAWSSVPLSTALAEVDNDSRNASEGCLSTCVQAEMDHQHLHVCANSGSIDNDLPRVQLPVPAPLDGSQNVGSQQEPWALPAMQQHHHEQPQQQQQQQEHDQNPMPPRPAAVVAASQSFEMMAGMPPHWQPHVPPLTLAVEVASRTSDASCLHQQADLCQAAENNHASEMPRVSATGGAEKLHLGRTHHVSLRLPVFPLLFHPCLSYWGCGAGG